MKKKYWFFIIVTLILSVISFSISMMVLWKQFLEENGLPSGVMEVEIFDDGDIEVTIDSEIYYFSLPQFENYYDRCLLKVKKIISSSSMWVSEQTIYLEKRTEFMNKFWVTLKEMRSYSVILWIEKKEG